MNTPPTTEKWFKTGLKLFCFTSGDDAIRGFAREDIQRIKDAEWNAAIVAASETCSNHPSTYGSKRAILSLIKPEGKQ